MIDLHIHSTASDGSFSPLEIIGLAKKACIKAISITDHDTIEGVKKVFQGSSLSHGPELITGVEISCTPPPEFKNIGSVHLLGYGFSIYDKDLNSVLEKAKNARSSRNPRIIEKLNDLGFNLSMEQVEKRFGAEQIGRPHMAELMKEKGFVQTFGEAFDKYLGKDKPAYVEKYKVSCQKAIHIILAAGGLPVLAHPGLFSFSNNRHLERFIDTLITYGLEGMEIYYTDHDEKITRYLQTLATRKNLLATGGSDFHGVFNEGVHIGSGKANLNVDDALFKTLNDRLENIREKNGEWGGVSLLEKNLGYSFTNPDYIHNALCHKSFVNENPDNGVLDNERLEFIGDAVLGLCIGHLLMEISPLKNEGELSKLRSGLVSEPSLADMARQIDLGRFIRLGKGERLSRGFDKDSILSDAFEAVMAAVYLDAGFDVVHGIIHTLFNEKLDEMLTTEKTMDYKSTLQEFVQEKGVAVPMYQLLNETGPDHDKTFEIGLTLFGIESRGLGKTKKAAEQDSARNALKRLEK